MLLQVKNQGFPELIQELGIQSPLQGPFWGFESTVIPIVDIRGPALPGIVYEGFSSAGQLAAPAANSILAQTNANLFRGAWALKFSWTWTNTSANNSFIAIQRMNDAYTVVLEEEIVDIIGGTAIGERQVGSGSAEFILFKDSFGQPWVLKILQALATAGSVVVGSLRVRYLGDIPKPSSGF